MLAAMVEHTQARTSNISIYDMVWNRLIPSGTWELWSFILAKLARIAIVLGFGMLQSGWKLKVHIKFRKDNF